jgi:hypothetical protein
MARFLLAAAFVLAAGPVLAEQGAASGRPLREYCNTVPDLTVQRTDAVDNWVKICTVWFNAACREPEAAPAAEKKKEAAKEKR